MNDGPRIEVFHEIDAIRGSVLAMRARGNRVGLVPTMGALHAGHLSLVRASLAECDWTVVTIFVNPTQFGPREDFSRYPRTWDADLDALRQVGAHAVFAPSPETLYPEGFSTYVAPPDVADVLEGEHRPGHFRGVATVVLKLFHILPADVAYFGQKDYQQCQVIGRMVDDLNVPITLRVEATVREPDGLALSSRNAYLSPSERERALALSRGLRRAESDYRAGERDARVLADRIRETLTAAGVMDIDYATVVDAETLRPTERVDRPCVALIAARVGATRLIDNVILDAERNTVVPELP